jgi:RNA polymerase sigma-70 factor (ECF subfamily)
MSDEQCQFDALMERLRQGSQDAAWELVEVYGPFIRRVVRKTLDRRLRPKFDSLDFVQAVWASFFRHREQFDKFREAKNLVAFLVRVARNKVIDENRRRLGTAKYDVRRERSLYDPEAAASESLLEKPPQTRQAAVARERWEAMLHRQPRQYQRVVEMRLAGFAFKEIGAMLGISDRTAKRVIQRLLTD